MGCEKVGRDQRTVQKIEIIKKQGKTKGNMEIKSKKHMALKNGSNS